MFFSSTRGCSVLIVFSCFFSLFHLEQFPSLSLSFITMIVLKNAEKNLFLREQFLFWICLLFSHDYTQFMIPIQHKWSFSQSITTWVHSIYLPLIGYIYFDNFAKVLQFLHYKGETFLKGFLWRELLVGFEPCSRLNRGRHMISSSPQVKRERFQWYHVESLICVLWFYQVTVHWCLTSFQEI